jgi:hypothetical protein
MVMQKQFCQAARRAFIISNVAKALRKPLRLALLALVLLRLFRFRRNAGLAHNLIENYGSGD